MLMELFVPKGALSDDQRRRVSERLVTEVMRADTAPADLIARGRAMSYVVVHESDAMVGGRPVDATEPPHYVVRVSVPAEHNTDGMRAEIVARITRALAEVDADPHRLYQAPTAWVHIIEVPDGNMGAFGQVMRIGDIVKLVVNPEAAPTGRSTPPESAAPDTVIDPICGMSVALTDTAITLTRDGAVYAFCSTACRDIFAAQQRAAQPHSHLTHHG
jgi:YHS domain-containing protein/phenylpyruvate tautomerase PptA (4-oxalocrotonate tautomerase family)